ncbi:MAG: hypothetical protein ACFFDI_28640 [Promethearchaeota archaeon]
MKQLRFLLIFTVLFISCTKFELPITEIYPTISIIGDKIGLEYTLGDLKICDTLSNVSDKYIEYIEHHKENVKFAVKVEYNNEGVSSTYFTYYVDGVQLITTENVVSADALIQHRDSIDGFISCAVKPRPSGRGAVT